MVRNIPLASLGQLSCFCPLPAPCARSAPLAGRVVQGVEMSLALYSTAQQQLETSVCYQHCFSPKTEIEHHTKHYEEK